MKNYTQVINMAEDFIERNLNKSISLADIANNVHMSEYHFHRIFRLLISETIYQYISRIKLERSLAYLLANNRMSITDIAYHYGYSESSSYCRAFKKHFQISPLQYRKARLVNI